MTTQQRPAGCLHHDWIHRYLWNRSLQKRADEFSEKIETCKGEIATKELDTNQSNKVMVQEAPKASVERCAVSDGCTSQALIAISE